MKCKHCMGELVPADDQSPSKWWCFDSVGTYVNLCEKSPSKAHEPMIEWTPEDRAAAAAEGWDLFDCDTGEDEDGNTDRDPVEVQRIDTPDDGAPLLESDDVAHAIIARGIRNDSPLHLKARAFLAQEGCNRELAYIDRARRWEHRPGDRYRVAIGRLVGTLDDCAVAYSLLHTLNRSVKTAQKHGERITGSDDFNIWVIRGGVVAASLCDEWIVDDEPFYTAQYTAMLDSGYGEVRITD